MICYRDRTFCNYYKDCQHGAACSRSLTQNVIDSAGAFGLPVSQYADKPQCHLKVIPAKERVW